MAKRKKAALVPSAPAAYGGLVTGIADLLEQARRTTAARRQRHPDGDVLGGRAADRGVRAEG